MATTLAEMVAKGQRKFAAKVPTMRANYDTAKPRAIQNYGALPFGPRTKQAYAAGIQGAVYTAPDPQKWARNWQAAMSR
jgi:hypothetical protein